MIKRLSSLLRTIPYPMPPPPQKMPNFRSQLLFFGPDGEPVPRSEESEPKLRKDYRVCVRIGKIYRLLTAFLVAHDCDRSSLIGLNIGSGCTRR